jgi:hypothetical protein
MITNGGDDESVRLEGVQVLVRGLILQMALVPTVHLARLRMPEASHTIAMATLLAELTVFGVMLLARIRWRRAWDRLEPFREEPITDRCERVGQLVFDLFLSEIIHYPVWLQRSRVNVPQTVTHAARLTPDTLKLGMSASEYLFTFQNKQQPDGSTSGALTLTVSDACVLSVIAALLEDQWTMRGFHHTVVSFIDGPWVEELFRLEAEVEVCRRSRTKRA